jgi:hypothetical protein
MYTIDLDVVPESVDGARERFDALGIVVRRFTPNGPGGSNPAFVLDVPDRFALSALAEWYDGDPTALDFQVANWRPIHAATPLAAIELLLDSGILFVESDEAGIVRARREGATVQRRGGYLIPIRFGDVPGDLAPITAANFLIDVRGAP